MESPWEETFSKKRFSREPASLEAFAIYPDDVFAYGFDPLLPDGDDERQTGYMRQALPQYFYDVLKIFTSVVFTLALIAIGFMSFWATAPNLAIQLDGCQRPIIRREWRMLSEVERQNYTASVKCLSEKPSRLGLNTSLYDDFVYIHLQVFKQAHKVAASLPWHRYYLSIYEQALKEDCGYGGHMAYWDWTLDAADPQSSTIWSPSIGFGGDGDPDEKCVQDGPFASIVPKYSESGFGPEYSPHCLKRNFTIASNMHGLNYTQDVVEDLIRNSESYDEFRTTLENGAHKYVHLGIGGEMPTKKSSNDPIFFVHHTQIDRLWWRWQKENPEIRFSEYGGYQPEAGVSSTHNSLASSEDVLQMFGLGKDLTVKEMLSTKSHFVCYEYLEETL